LTGMLLLADHQDFGRRLKELVAGQNQIDVANRLGYTAPRVSQIMRGEKPSREFVERLIEAYTLPREEWLAMAGFGPRGIDSDERQALAEAAAREVLRQQEDPNAALGRVIDAAERGELVYEPEFEDVDVRNYRGGDRLSENDAKLVNEALRALLSEQRRRQGRE
jgi:transcriptional regulator with XRE-family HTH domain